MSESLDATASESAPSPPTNARSARILEAASRCFSDKGFQSTTIIDIADAAGVSRPLVYKYFGDKDRLIDSALRAAFADWEALNDPPLEITALPIAPGATATTNEELAADALEEKFRKSIEFVGQRPIFKGILQNDPQIVMRGHLEALRRCRAVSAASTRAILMAGAETGEFRAELDADAATASIEMILFGLLERALGIRPELVLDSALERTTIDLLLSGLLSPRSAP